MSGAYKSDSGWGRRSGGGGGGRDRDDRGGRDDRSRYDDRDRRDDRGGGYGDRGGRDERGGGYGDRSGRDSDRSGGRDRDDRGPRSDRGGEPPRTTLFVAGFPPEMRAKDLAYEFERMGRLVRCDIPALKTPTATPYAFIEYENPRDTETAFDKMNGMRFGRNEISIQFAKNAPSANWRFDGPSAPGGPPPPAYGGRDEGRGRGYGGREERGGYGGREERGGYSGREERGGYGSRDAPRGGGYGSAPAAPWGSHLSPDELAAADRAAEERAQKRAARRERSPGAPRDEGSYRDDRQQSSRDQDEVLDNVASKPVDEEMLPQSSNVADAVDGQAAAPAEGEGNDTFAQAAAGWD